MASYRGSNHGLLEGERGIKFRGDPSLGSSEWLDNGQGTLDPHIPIIYIPTYIYITVRRQLKGHKQHQSNDALLQQQKREQIKKQLQFGWMRGTSVLLSCEWLSCRSRETRTEEGCSKVYPRKGKK